MSHEMNMTNDKPLKNCTPSEVQAYVAIVRLAAELKEKDAFDEPTDDLFHAIYQTVNLVYFASDIMQDQGGENEEN